ncbi:MAG: HTTM domain-containing protein, partial [Saprospiraceae bacterium]
KVLEQSSIYLLLYSSILRGGMWVLGVLYRLASLVFFLSFTYLELIDATNYLNHYYLVCIFAFLLIFLPAHRAFSIDAWLFPKLKVKFVPAWTIHILIAQLVIVYTCAGIAKLNPDWLFRAMPLLIWLPEHRDLFLLGYFFKFKWVAYLFSWTGAIYDLSIAYFLLFSKTRNWAYLAVIIFHLMTFLLFNIGLFPFIMIFSTLIFFPAATHEKILIWLGYQNELTNRYTFRPFNRLALQMILGFFLFLQFLLPFRHWLYPGNVLWTEEGYRFSWRVMLVEKIGHTVFYIEDGIDHRKVEVNNGRYLTLFQEKQLNVQADFILQFAHFLKKEYQEKHGFKNPIVTVDAHVAINGRTSQRYIDPTVDLAKIEDGWSPKSWILK